MGKELELAIKIGGRLDKSLGSAVNNAQKQLNSISKNASLSNKLTAVGSTAETVGKTILKTVGVATVTGLVASAKEAGQLNKELANIGTLSVPTERLQQFKKEIQDIAIATGKNTSDISEGTYQVVSAFGDAPDTMKKVEINAKAAKAGLATTADSIALTSAVTKAYGDTTAGAVQHVADLAFKTVELGQTTFPELAENMQQVTSLSKQLGVSQEELFGSYATLTGVTGSAAEVQTQMKAVYTALLKPTKNMQSAVSKLGFSSGYTMIKTLGFAETLKALVKATDGSDEALLSLFNNQRALPAVLALTGAQADTFSQKLEKMKNASGAATKAFEVQTDGIAKTGFTLEQAKVKIQVAAQKFGDSAAPLIADVADLIDKASTALSNLSESQRKSIINTGIGITKAGLVLTIGGKLLTTGTKIFDMAKRLGKLRMVGGATGLVGSFAATIAPATLAAAAIFGIAAAVNAVHKHKLNYASGMNEAADGIEKASNALVKYNDIAAEIPTLRKIISDGNSTPQEVETAKARLQEIADLLSEEYNLTINADTSSLENAVNMAQQLSRTDLINESSNLIKKAQKGASQYKTAAGKIPGLEEQQRSLQDQQALYQSLQKTAEQYYTAFENGQIDNAKYLSQMNELYSRAQESGAITDKFGIGDKITNQNSSEFLRKLSNGFLTVTDSLTAVNGELELAKSNVAEVDSSSQKAGEYLAQALASDVKANNAYGAESDISMITNLGTALVSAGKNTDELSTQFAKAKTGYTDFAEAIKNGKAAEMSQNFIDFKKSIGDTAESAVSGAAVIASGFENVTKATEAGNDAVLAVIGNMKSLGDAQHLFDGLDSGGVADKLTDMAHALNLIPENKSISIDANGNFEIIAEAENQIASLRSQGNVDLYVNANGDLSIYNEATQQAEILKGIGAVSLSVNADGNIDVLNQAQEKIATIDKKTGKPTLTATDNATSKITSVSNKLSSLNGKTAKTTIITEYKQKGKAPAHNATGTSNWRGGLTYVNDQNISDPREVIEHSGMRYWYEGKNILANIPRGAKIYNALRSRAFINGSHRNGLERVPFDGYIAELHAGERVLTDTEASDYRDNDLFAQAIERLKEALNGGGKDNRRNGDTGNNGTQINFSPNVTINGNSDEGTIISAMKISAREFKKMYEEMVRDERRKSF